MIVVIFIIFHNAIMFYKQTGGKPPRPLRGHPSNGGEAQQLAMVFGACMLRL